MDYSLPYCTTLVVDQPHEDYEQYALSLIEEEMKQIQPRPLLHRDMKVLNCRTKLMKQEYDTLFQNQTATGAAEGEAEAQEDENDDGDDDDDTHKLMYVPRKNVTLADFDTTPPPKRPKLSDDMNDAEKAQIIKEWKLHALSYARSKYEAERIRNLNLDVEKQVSTGGGSSSSNWKRYIEQTLQDMEVQYSRTLQHQRDVVDEINYQRQSSQERMYGPQLEQYYTEYQQVLYKRNTVEYNIFSEEMKKETTTTTNQEEG